MKTEILKALVDTNTTLAYLIKDSKTAGSPDVLNGILQNILENQQIILFTLGEMQEKV